MRGERGAGALGNRPDKASYSINREEAAMGAHRESFPSLLSPPALVRFLTLSCRQEGGTN